jgi:hypothetical protein
MAISSRPSSKPSPQAGIAGSDRRAAPGTRVGKRGEEGEAWLGLAFFVAAAQALEFWGPKMEGGENSRSSETQQREEGRGFMAWSFSERCILVYV